MRRIILLMTVGALVVVGTLLVVSVAGAHKHPTAKAQKHPTKTVSIQNFSFKPAHITIKRGTKVRWINKDSTAHTVTANKKRSFNSGRLGPGKRYTHTHLQEHGEEEIPLQHTSRYEGKRGRQALAVDEGKRLRLLAE